MNQMIWDKNTILLGSMLWVEPNESEDVIEGDIRGMLAQGLTIARLFISPLTVRRGRDEWTFSTWDRVFSLSEKLGLKLTVTLSALACETWFQQEWGKKPQDLSWYAESRRIVRETARKVVDRYKASTALHSWILQNEPCQRLSPNAWTLPLFRDWLPGRYEYEVCRLRAAYESESPFSRTRKEPREKADPEACRKYAETIGEILPEGSAILPNRDSSYHCKTDWARFQESMLNRHLLELAQVVKSADPLHPVTINPAGLADISPEDGGRSVFSQGRTVDFLGCSCHVSWHSYRFPADRIQDSVAMFCDMTRSATADPDGYFWVTEMQSGTNFFSGSRPMCPSGADMTRWLWEAIGSGCRGIIYWLYRARPTGFEGLEWGLMNQLGGPSHRSEASKAVFRTLESRKALFSAARPSKYDGYVLVSTDSSVLSQAETPFPQLRNEDPKDARNLRMIQDGWCGAYGMLRSLGYSVGFADASSFDGTLPKDSFLVIPNAYSMTPETAEAVLRYARRGGTVIADGLMGAKDPWGRISGNRTQAALTGLFGTPVQDWGVSTCDFDFSIENFRGSLPGWFLYCAFPEGTDAQVLARGPEGDPAFIRRPVGSGRAVYLGTLFFQSWFAFGNRFGYREFLRELLPPVKGTHRLLNPSQDLILRTLEGDEGDVLVLMRSGGETEALLSSPANALEDILTGEVFSAGQSEDYRIPLAPDQIRVLTQKA